MRFVTRRDSMYRTTSAVAALDPSECVSLNFFSSSYWLHEEYYALFVGCAQLHKKISGFYCKI